MQSKKVKKHNLLIETTISYTTYINTWTLQEQELEQEQGQAGTEHEEEQEQEGSSDLFGPYWEIMLLFVFASLCVLTLEILETETLILQYGPHAI